MSFNHIGSVSSGTMRNEDLIPDFASLLRELGCTDSRLTEIEQRIKTDDDGSYFDSEDADYDLNEFLFDALNKFAPPYFYFGAHPGDGADYGFWLCEEWQEQAADSDSPIVTDAGELPENYEGEWFQVSDHGNVTLYVRTGTEDEEVWSIV